MPLCRSIVFLLTTLSGSLCLGQVSPGMSLAERTKTYTVTGTVNNAATGEPVRRALVHVNGQVQLSAFTGPDGRFQVTGVPEGQAFVTAEKPGFFNEESLQPGPYTSQNAAVNV